MAQSSQQKNKYEKNTSFYRSSPLFCGMQQD